MCLVIAWWIVTLDTFDHQCCLAKPHLITVRGLGRRARRRERERAHKESQPLPQDTSGWADNRPYSVKKPHIKNHNKWHAIKLRGRVESTVRWTYPWDKDKTHAVAKHCNLSWISIESKCKILAAFIDHFKMWRILLVSFLFFKYVGKSKID